MLFPNPSPVWSSHCQLIREFRIKLRVKFCMIMSAKPTHVAKIKIQLFQHLVRMTYICVAWHLTYVDMTRISHFSKCDKIKPVNIQKSCHEWNRSIVYIFMFFNNSTEILVSSAEPWSPGWSQDRYGHVMSLRNGSPQLRSDITWGVLESNR